MEFYITITYAEFGVLYSANFQERKFGVDFQGKERKTLKEAQSDLLDGFLLNIEHQKEWVDHVLGNRDNYDNEQIARADRFYILFKKYLDDKTLHTKRP